MDWPELCDISPGTLLGLVPNVGERRSFAGEKPTDEFGLRTTGKGDFGAALIGSILCSIPGYLKAKKHGIMLHPPDRKHDSN
jgi:hypothetical protein